MKTLPLSIVKDHLLVELAGGHARALLDTGSPRTQRPPREAVDFIGPFRWLVGNDVLSRRLLTIDWPGRKVSFGEVSCRGNVTVLGNHGGVPTISVSAGGVTGQAFLDTGAPLTYVPPTVFEGAARSSVTREEFYPGQGSFAVETRQLMVDVADRRLAATVGLLPAPVRNALGLGVDSWILGIDFFRNRMIHLDLAAGVLRDSSSPLDLDDNGDSTMLWMLSRRPSFVASQGR